MKKLVFLFSLFHSFVLAQAQKENYNWYFGDKAGLNFHSAPSTALTDGAMFVSEGGCASVSDREGNLLFYTNGSTVYNKEHKIMDKGGGLGGISAAQQSVVIVPHPGNPNLYYIFLSAYRFAAMIGYNYAIVDISKNGGLGEVVIKNQFLYRPGSEMLTVARHANKKDFWVVTKPVINGEFRCYLVNENGLNLTPVVSPSDLLWPESYIGGSGDSSDAPIALGFMKISQNSKKLAMISYLTKGKLFDFDNATGKVGNGVGLNFSREITAIEFSAETRFMYVLYGRRKAVDQFDIGATINLDSAALEATRTTITPPNAYMSSVDSVTAPSSLQIGPDGRIYIASLLTQEPLGTFKGPNYLGVIEFPDEQGMACTFRERGVELNGRAGAAKLPNLIPNLKFPFSLFEVDIIATIIDSCTRTVKFEAVSNQTRNIQYEWDLGNQVSTLQLLQKTFSFEQDTFWVNLKITADVPVNAGVLTRTKYKKIKLVFAARPLADAGEDLLAAKGIPIQLNGSGGVSYQWSPVQYLDDPMIANPKATLQVDQVFTVKVKNNDGCESEDQVTVKVFKAPDILVPTAFTPNKDGKNDLLKVFPVGIKLERFAIYNRWGNLIFVTNAPENGWNGTFNGKPQPEGAYVWVANGLDVRGHKFSQKGTINLLR